MNNILLILLLVIIVMQAIIYINAKRRVDQPTNKSDIDVRGEMNAQTNAINSALQMQNKYLESQISRIDQNMLTTNNQLQKILNSLFKDIETSQQKQSDIANKNNVEVAKQLAKINAIDESILNLQERVVDLSMILGNSKARGNLGEMQLYQLVENVYGVNNPALNKQDKLSTGVICDLSLKANTLEKKICIDAKFPLENYVNFQETGEQGFKTLFERDIKKHITDIASKYIIGDETANYAIMFIPSESIYLEVMENPNLIEFSMKNKVWITSPTTLLALLAMIDNMETDYKRAENANQIERELETLGVEFDRFNKRYLNLEKHISQVVKDFEDIQITQRKLSKKFEDIRKFDIGREEEDE